VTNKNFPKLRAIGFGGCDANHIEECTKKRYEINWVSLNDVEWKCEVRSLTSAFTTTIMWVPLQKCTIKYGLI